MVHATIDIETISTRPNAVVLTIGGVKFDPMSNDDPHSKFYYRIDVNEQTAMGRDVEEDTLKWWSTQPEEIMMDALGDDDRHSVEDTMKALNKWLVGVDKIWCQGPVFDICILENLATDIGSHYNWKFWQIRDSRTLFGLLPKDPRKEMNFAAHNALEDAIVQSVCVQKAYRDLGVS